jgi:hypothetical protein
METSDAIAVAGVAVAITAVLGALFQEDVKRWRLRPRVNAVPSVSVFPVLLKSEDRRAADTVLPHAYLRLKITAEGRSTARRLQAQLVSCDPAPKLGGEIATHETELLIPLRWSFSHDAFVDLPPGGARFVDLAEMKHREDHAALTTLPAPREGQRMVAGPTYRLEIRIVGENVHAKTVLLDVTNTGGWDGSAASAVASLSVQVAQLPNAKVKRLVRARSTPSGT